MSHRLMTRCLLRYLPGSLLLLDEHPDVLGHVCQQNAYSTLCWQGLQVHPLVVNMEHWGERQWELPQPLLQDVLMNQVSGKQSWPYKMHEKAHHNQVCP